ncbi:MAG: P27 family phage terminase small subunit [Actinomycetota bacterium]|nr:P27 family phage terminase small subunit [Actinomycetota bacterium]
MKNPPKHLSRQTKAWWKTVAEGHYLEEWQYRTLTSACEAWDRGVQAREQIDAEGLTITDRFGQSKAHPLLAVERDCRIAFLRAVRELALEVDGPASSPPSARPPRIRAVQ